MRVTQLREAIASQPLNLKLWLKNRIANLSNASEKAKELKRIVAENISDGDYLLRWALGHVMGERPFLPDSYDVDLDKRYQLSRLADNLDAMGKYGNDFLKYTMNTLEDINPISIDTKTILMNCNKVDAGFKDYGYDPTDPKLAEDSEYKSAKNLADAYYGLYVLINSIEKEISGMTPILKDRKLRIQHTFTPEKYRPTHESVETLYHASLYAADLATKGFAAERPLERRGLGALGLDTQDRVSVTHSYPVAHDIFRSFKELWMIVHGELKRKDILQWMHTENLNPKFAESLYLTSRYPKDSVVNTVGLYRAYLGMSKIRRDPVIFNLEELIVELQKIPLSSIGIVECQVDLTGDPEYMHSEAEFRIKANKILTVRRII